jgi:hypothetical protein
MNYTESFDQFASRLGPMDLALYAGAGLIIWVLFKDKLSPVQQFLTNLIKKKTSDVPVVSDDLVSKIFNPDQKTTEDNSEDIFFDLVLSWKQTRDLAVKSGCNKAIEVADQMFPFLSPSVCSKKEVTNEQ